MPEITPFCFEDVVVRTLIIDQEPWFVAADVCAVLEHTNPTMAIESLDDDERAKKSLGRQGDANIISESGLYTLIIRSNKPQAKPFRRWVTREVLPAIRKTGSYNLVPARKEKLVTVDHRHSKSSGVNPHGIQYRLDLTRIVTKPTRQALTGVDFSDIELEADLDEPSLLLSRAIDAFIVACCQDSPADREGSSRLYQAFLLWLEQSGMVGPNAPTHRAFGLYLKKHTQLVQKRYSDGVYWYGIRLTDAWAEQVSSAADQAGTR